MKDIVPQYCKHCGIKSDMSSIGLCDNCKGKIEIDTNFNIYTGEYIKRQQETMEDTVNEARQYPQQETKYGNVDEKINNDSNKDAKQHIIGEAMQKQQGRDKTKFMEMTGRIKGDIEDSDRDIDIKDLPQEDKEALLQLMSIVEDMRLRDVIDAVGDENAGEVLRTLCAMKLRLRQ